MMNRRTFLETATTLTAATLLSNRIAWAAADHKIDKLGVQLYSVRDQMKADFDGTLAKVAAIGYQEVEFAGYFGRTPSTSAPPCEKPWSGSRLRHVRGMCSATNGRPAIESAKIIGLRYIVCPWIPEEIRNKPDVWKQRRRKIQPSRRSQPKRPACSSPITITGSNFFPSTANFPTTNCSRLCDAKTCQDGNGSVLDHRRRRRSHQIFQSLSRAIPAGPRQGPEEDSQRLPRAAARISETRSDMTAVGSGIIDWKRIFAQSEKAGIKHYIVEHDKAAVPFDSITASYQYLHQLRW